MPAYTSKRHPHKVIKQQLKHRCRRAEEGSFRKSASAELAWYRRGHFIISWGKILRARSRFIHFHISQFYARQFLRLRYIFSHFFISRSISRDSRMNIISRMKRRFSPTGATRSQLMTNFAADIDFIPITPTIAMPAIAIYIHILVLPYRAMTTTHTQSDATPSQCCRYWGDGCSNAFSLVFGLVYQYLFRAAEAMRIAEEARKEYAMRQ